MSTPNLPLSGISLCDRRPDFCSEFPDMYCEKCEALTDKHYMVHIDGSLHFVCAVCCEKLEGTPA